MPALASKLPVASTLSPAPLLGFHAHARTDRLCPPATVDASANDVRLYTRTVLSDEAVATTGRDGCGAVIHVRAELAGVSVARGWSIGGGVVSVVEEGIAVVVVVAVVAVRRVDTHTRVEGGVESRADERMRKKEKRLRVCTKPEQSCVAVFGRWRRRMFERSG